jgi:SHS2 domain-containing protein
VRENRFEEVEHTADIAIRVWGADLAELFANAAYGMACQLTDVEDVELGTTEQIDLRAPDVEMLLVNWLSELLYLGEREDVAFVDFDLSEVTPHTLQAVVRGGPISEHRVHIKAVTFSQLNIVKTDQGYETIVVFDV